MNTSPTAKSAELRMRLRQIQAKYDGGGMPQALYNVCKAIEREIAWEEIAWEKQREDRR